MESLRNRLYKSIKDVFLDIRAIYLSEKVGQADTKGVTKIMGKREFIGYLAEEVSYKVVNNDMKLENALLEAHYKLQRWQENEIKRRTI